MPLAGPTPALDSLTHQPPTSLPLPPPRRSPWILPGTIILISLACLAAAGRWPEWSRLLYLVPYTFLGNSLAPLPYDGAVVYLGSRFSLPLIVSAAVAATLIIEMWNIEVLTRVLARDGTSGFRNHRITQWMLRWYRKAPFWSLVATCVLPVVPHYPMRFLAVLAGYPLWQYQLSVTLGRGIRSGDTSCQWRSAEASATPYSPESGWSCRYPDHGSWWQAWWSWPSACVAPAG
jgi:membrane protein YqaA with SNARE-associated domain